MITQSSFSAEVENDWSDATTPSYAIMACTGTTLLPW
jgi:hypothetical protein